ncbi:class I SAM-dependent methyltransferase [Filobacillus milosensis]|uniref:Class I SAM-dependent methyltransferase n=1 Tax=Filobacillus milosensis TaxID=94137 RepID=A0A4Y8IH16_9BACI|nr:class I SAM-dependent methyltransferase [Filobacillus milosensis]TFB14737.1 class I SAM-dependent methyltransferase [Filobacillus milosensis]
MSDHYYSQKPTSKSNPSRFQTTLNSITLNFQTDEGVFSKKQIDYGTKALINSFIQPDQQGDLLDLGCGYGPIGLTLAKSYPNRHVVMLDINERAIELTKKNFEANGLSNVEVYQSDGLNSVKDREFAAVITNPPFRAGKKVVHSMVEDSYHVLSHMGEFWLVVQKKQGAPSLKEKMNKVFGNVEVINRDKGYFILRSKKFDSDMSV